MTQRCTYLQTIWPWFFIASVLVMGLVIASCSSQAATATPTPTKTPRPAGSQATATPPATAAAQSEPSTSAAAPTAQATAVAGTVGPTAVGPTAVAKAPAAATATKSTAAPTTAPGKAATATSTTPPRPPAPGGSTARMRSPEYGIQAFLWWRPEVADRDLDLVKDGGFGWVKQYFAWQDIEGARKGAFDWERADRIVDEANKRGLKLLVRIGMDPDRPFWAGEPPDNAAHFADFVGQVAGRYKGRIHAYQIWNEPNLNREWGKKRPDPAAYVRMLRAAYGKIKAADPTATVITAGMAPTTEDSNRAMPDLRFYQGMYDAMGGKSDGYFDMLGVHGAGYAAPPEMDPQVVATDPKLHNNDPSPTDLKRVYAFRHVEDVRDLMMRNGDGNKQIAVLEFGWTTDNRPNSDYYWHGAGAGIDDTTQGKYIIRAFEYARQNWQPWIGVMSLIYIPDVKWTDKDEQTYWSILGPGYPELNLRAPYVIVCDYLNKLNGAKCKHAPPS